MRARTLAVNAFDMCCLGHIQQGLWRHPRDRSKNFEHLAYWTDYAHRLERGLFDGLFLADVVGIYDVYQNSPDAAIRSAVQVPVNDPMLIIPAMALVTRHLGFGVTVNLSYESPYLFARRMSTLDHLTQGRIAWNIVTGYLDSAARAQGFQQQMKHDDRYDLADEFMEVVYKLWEDSWADDALSSQFDSRDYADPTKIQAIKHEGKQYRLDARHLCSPSIQRTPMLYQAGASTRGQAFAGKHAECIFLNGQSFEALATLTKAFRSQAVACGRKREDIKIFVGASLIAAGTKAEAQDRYDEYRQYVDSEAALVHASASMGVDLAKVDLEEPVQTSVQQSQAVQSNVQAVMQQHGKQWTKADLLRQMVLGSRQTPIVGSGSELADYLVNLQVSCDVDGINLSRTVVPECFDDFIDHVVPALQDRGAYKTQYEEGSIRRKLFGSDRLPLTHPARAAYDSARSEENP
ncbi:MAG: LLM class flavin-dependent oxidoreductase [Burkholderiales bacterium]